MVLTRHQQTTSLDYTVVDDRTARRVVMATLPLVEEGTGAPLAATVRSLTAGVAAKVVAGLVVLSGSPSLTLPITVELDVQIPRSAGRRVSAVIPAGPLPALLPALRAEPPTVSLAGLVADRLAPFAPIPAADLVITTLLGTPALVTLRAPLAFDHAAASPVSTRSLTAVGAPVAPAQAAVAGQKSIEVTARAPFAPGRAVTVGAPHQADVVRIVAVSGTSITLAHALRRSAPAGAPVTAATIGAPGATQPLAVAAAAGHGVVRLAGPLAGAVLEVTDPSPSRAELVATGAISAADGRWRLDGVPGVGPLTITVTATGFPTTALTHHPDHHRTPNVVDIAM